MGKLIHQRNAYRIFWEIRILISSLRLIFKCTQTLCGAYTITYTSGLRSYSHVCLYVRVAGRYDAAVLSLVNMQTSLDRRSVSGLDRVDRQNLRQRLKPDCLCRASLPFERSSCLLSVAQRHFSDEQRLQRWNITQKEQKLVGQEGLHHPKRLVCLLKKLQVTITCPSTAPAGITIARYGQ